MRVLHVFKTYLPDTTGGIEQVIFQLCQGGQPLGIQGEVLTLSPHPEPAHIVVGTHSVYRAKQDLCLASTGLSRQIFGLYRERIAEADIVHFHFPWPLMDILHFCTQVRRPTVLSYHSDIVRQKLLLNLYRPLMQRFLSSVDKIIVASPNYQQSSEVLQAYRHKTEVIPFGLDVDAYPHPSAERLAFWQQRFSGSPFFLFVGVLRYYKGLHTALEALQGTDYPLVIVGSGPEEHALKHQAQALGLKQVQFLGKLNDEDKVCLLQLCRGFVFPSHLRSEAFGMSLLEAAMYAKPMISCEIGTGTSFVNQHEVTGLVVPPEHPQALRSALKQLWDHPEYAAQLGQGARQRFNTLFTAQRMCSDMARVYQQLMSTTIHS